MGITSVTKKGQVTIPADVRRALKIKERDRVEVTVDGDKAVIKKLSAVSDLRGSIPVTKTRRGADWRRIERETAKARGQQGA